MPIHSQATGDEVHSVVGLGPYANEAARLAATPAATDVGKVAKQTDNGTHWILVSHSPLAWRPIDSHRYEGTHETENDTPETFFSLSDDHILPFTTAFVVVTVKIRSKDDTTGNGHSVMRLCVRREDTATVTLVKAVVPYGIEGDAEAEAYGGLSADQNGDAIDLKVEGAAATNVVWGWIVTISDVTYDRDLDS